MAWCEANRVDFLFGLARNARLEETVRAELIAASLDAIRSFRPARRFKDFRYATLDSWSRERRVVGKAEVTGDKANPRFIVTSLAPAEIDGNRCDRTTYEICVRAGKMRADPDCGRHCDGRHGAGRELVVHDGRGTR